MANGIFDGKPYTQQKRLNITEELRLQGVPFVPSGGTPVPVLSAQSTALQDPGALDTPIQVEFGPAQGGPTDAVQIDAAGLTTFNQGGAYQAIALFSPSRTTSTGEAILFIRSLFNAVQFQNPIGGRFDDDDNTIPLQFVGNAVVSAGTELTFEFYRDSAGINNGSLSSETSSIGWGSSSSASLQIFKFA